MHLCRSSLPLVLVSLLFARPVAADDPKAAGDPWTSRGATAGEAAPARAQAPASAAAAAGASSETWSTRGSAAPAAQGKAAPAKQAHRKKTRGRKKAATPRAAVGPIAMSPGFVMLKGGKSRVFVEVSQKLDVTELKAQGRLTYRIRGASVPLRNNRLPLLTGFFPTPVLEARLIEQGGDVDLVIVLRQPSEAEHRVIESEGGMVVQVDFPAVTSFVPPPIPGVATTARNQRMTRTKTLQSSGGSGD